MTKTSMLRTALLGSAALLATVSAASADQLGDLKAQLAALQSQVNTLQATQASALPAGAALITMTQGGAENGLGYTFSVLPSADVPAATTSVTVSGEVRALGTYTSLAGSGQTSKSTWDINNRARVKVVGKTETSVGDVGAAIRIQDTTGDDDAPAVNYAVGTWQMTPEWQLEAGRDDSAAAIQAGIDWMFSGGPTGNYGGPTNRGADQFRLNYKSGPVSGAVALESYAGDKDHRTPAVAAFVGFDPVAGTSLYLSGAMDKDSTGDNSDYFAGIGANMALGSSVTLTAAAGKGEGYAGGSYVDLDSGSTDVGYWNASAGVIYGLSDTTSVELGYGYTKTDNTVATNTKKVSDITAQVLWTPAKQLTVSFGGGYENASLVNGKDENTLTLGVGTWFRF